MPWVYDRASRTLFAPDGSVTGTGYSGAGLLLGDYPPAQSVWGEAIPEGLWQIGQSTQTAALAFPVVPLTPIGFSLPPGRDGGFKIHGDNATHDASAGCPIFGREIRYKIASSTDRFLRVK